MSPMNTVSSLSPLSLNAASPTLVGAAGTAQQLVGELGHRVLAWVDQIAPVGASGRANWTQQTGVTNGFAPDPAKLSRGGDVYGLHDLASQVSGQFGGTPTQEGELLRALEDFTRAAVVQVGGLAGAHGDRQVDGLRDALNVAGAADAGEGIEGVVARLEAGTRSLVAANG